jgi:hypothetical protein
MFSGIFPTDALIVPAGVIPRPFTRMLGTDGDGDGVELEDSEHPMHNALHDMPISTMIIVISRLCPQYLLNILILLCCPKRQNCPLNNMEYVANTISLHFFTCQLFSELIPLRN